MVSMISLFVLAFVAGTDASYEMAVKRGLAAYAGHSNWTCNDGELLHLRNSWHYTGTAHPSQFEKCNGMKISAEFVPMVSGIGQAEHMETLGFLREWSDLNAQYLLGYNEPNTNSDNPMQFKCTPADAARDWPYLQNVAAMFDPPLKLVAPGVSSAGGSGGSDSWDDNGHSTWLDEFFGNCTNVVPDCNPDLIEHIAMHDYHANVEQLKRRVSGARKRYGRKVWLAEFSFMERGNPPTREGANAYMKEVLPYLDSSEDIVRYAWFGTRDAPDVQNGVYNLLEADGSDRLTSTGLIYRDRSVETILV